MVRETVSMEGHLIDSDILRKAFDRIVEGGGEFSMVDFRIGRTNDEPSVALPAMSPQEEVFADYQTAGLSLKAHPISFFRTELDRLGVVPAERLAEMSHDESVCVAGLVLVRQRPGTARGVTFVTLEDDTGIINLIVRLEVWKRHYQVARTASAFDGPCSMSPTSRPV